MLKELCVNAPILAFPNYKLPFILHADSSTEGLGAVLYQKQEGKLKVIAYASRSVTKTESNCPAHKLEFLALKWAICEKFHEYLYGNTPFEVYTDNNPLTYVLTTDKLDSDDSSVKEDTAITELNTELQINEPNTEDDLPFIDSKNDSLVDTNEFLEFVDTLDTGEQTADIEPKSVTESQFSSVMSYHEGDSTPLMGPSTDSQELSKSLDVESTGELASGTVDHEDSSSHDIDVFASDTNGFSSQSIQNDSSVQPTDSIVTQSVVEDDSENVVSVEIAEPRRSGRTRKQTALYGNPLLYTITYKLTPRFVPAFLNKMSETLESLYTNYLKDSNCDDNP